ncbi:MAG: cobyrinate a,c-diamide synthase [Lachnospiraceae bacterium]|nr:cobyrinate a,c-diamide synthase [Lachnospiraceae bacterium]
MSSKFDTNPGFILAAPKSGSGKTTLTSAFLQALKDRGLRVQAFKCGPDYIDPMFHRQIIGVNSKNLDPYFSDRDQLRALYAGEAGERDIAVLEGAMGLYDGLGGISEEASAYQVARALHLPVILIVDAHGMGRSVIPLLAGFLQYDPEMLIRGVILNRTTGGFYESIAPVIERELPIPVLGYFPNDPSLHLESRHLGLKLPGEIDDLRQQTQKAAGMLGECVQIDRLLQITEAFCTDEAQQYGCGTDPVETPCPEADAKEADTMTEDAKTTQRNVRIAVATDEAFCFYYEDNLKLLEKLGAELVCFSPLHDEALPADIDGLILGGGYPELYAGQLEQNESMRQSIREALLGDLPSLAECGGFMYLHERLTLRDGNTYQMCGVLPGDCTDIGKLVRFGYIAVTEKKACFLPEGQSIRGHEFHYFDSSANGGDCTAEKPVPQKKWDCMHVTKRHWWGFPHLYYPSNEAFGEHFLAEARDFRRSE